MGVSNIPAMHFLSRNHEYKCSLTITSGLSAIRKLTLTGEKSRYHELSQVLVVCRFQKGFTRTVLKSSARADQKSRSIH